MLDLREILEDLYDAGFFAAYPNKKGRVSVRREAITAAEEAINEPSTVQGSEIQIAPKKLEKQVDVIIRETLREFTSGYIAVDPATDSMTVSETHRWIHENKFVETLMERLQTKEKL